MEILLAEQTTGVAIAVWGGMSADMPDMESRRKAVLSILMRSVLCGSSVISGGSPVAHDRSTSVNERRRSGVAHAVTPGGSYTSFRSSI